MMSNASGMDRDRSSMALAAITFVCMIGALAMAGVGVWHLVVCVWGN